MIIKPQGSIVSAGIYQFDEYIRGGRSGMISKDGYLDGCATGNLINRNATRETTYTGGYHEVEFRPESLPPGVYFFRIETGAYKETQKMILMR